MSFGTVQSLILFLFFLFLGVMGQTKMPLTFFFKNQLKNFKNKIKITEF
jgi:hypothetical protein